MSINYRELKSKIVFNVKDALSNGDPGYTEEEIEEGVELIFRVAQHNVKKVLFDGFYEYFIPSLQIAVVENPTDLPALRNLSNLLEAYAKRMLLITNKADYAFVSQKYATAIPVLKKLEINNALTTGTSTSYPQLDESNLNSFKNKKEYLYQICSTYNARNYVHVAKRLQIVEAGSMLVDLLILYVYMNLVYKDEILANTEDVGINYEEVVEEISSAEKRAEYLSYAYLTYGKDVIDVKQEVLEKYTLYILHLNDLSVSEIGKAIADQFNLRIDESHVLNLLNRLRTDKKIGKPKKAEKYQLEEKIRENIISSIENYKLSQQLSASELQQYIYKYNLSLHVTELETMLTDYYKSTFNRQIDEVQLKIIEGDKDYFINDSDLIRFLKENVEDAKFGDALYDIFEITKNNEFIIKVSASKVFADITRTDQVANFIKASNNELLIDTQIILHALCTGIAPQLGYPTKYTEVVERFIATHKNEKTLFVPKGYLAEAGYQVKLALMMLPYLENSSWFSSKNHLYQYYNHIKDEQDEIGVSSFREFLSTYLKVSYADAYRGNSNVVIERKVGAILEGLGFKVGDLPFYEVYSDHISYINRITRDKNLRVKSPKAITADAVALCYLAIEDTGLPKIFISWDASFKLYRDNYFDEFGGSRTLRFHQFTPGEWQSVSNLSKLNVTAETINSDALALVDFNSLSSKSKSIFDVMLQFTDLKNIAVEKQRLFLSRIDTLFEEKFGETVLRESDYSNNIASALDFAIETLNSYYTRQTVMDVTIYDYQGALSDESYFDDIIRVIVSLTNEEGKIVSKTKLVESVDLIVKKFAEHR